MKGKVSLLLAVCLLVGLSGCRYQGKTDSPTQPESAFAEENEQAADTLYLLSGETTAGLYHMVTAGDGQKICFVDYEKREEKEVCGKPDCPHTDKTCMAFPPEGRSIYFLNVLSDGSLVYLETSDINDGEPMAIYREDGDGNNRRKVASAENNQQDWQMLCADQQNLYILQTTYTEQANNQIFKISLQDGAMEALWNMPSQMPQLIGVNGRDLVLYEYLSDGSKVPQPQITSDMSEDEMEKLEKEYMEQLDAADIHNRVYLFSMDTGEEQELMSWTSKSDAELRSSIWADGRLYWCNNLAVGVLHWIAPDGASGEINVSWPEDILHPAETGDMVIHLERVLQGKMLLTVYGPWGMDLVKRYAVDLNDGTMQEIPLRYISNAYEQPIQILGQGNDGLLVEFEESADYIDSLDENGMPVQTLQFHYRRGMISWDDFFAGVPNYQEITQGI